MLQTAFYLSCGAAACYLWGRNIKREADSFSSITRVVDFKRLDELLKEKATNLLVVVSGKVVSATPSNGKHENGPLGAVFKAKAEMGYEKLEDDGSGWVTKSQNFLFQIKYCPWYLEDSTSGRVKVVGAEFANGFLGVLRNQFDMSLREIFERIERPQQGSKVILRDSLDIGTSLTIIGEAARDKAGNLTIQKPSEQTFRIFSGEDSFDKMVANLKSNSEFYFFFSKIFGTIAVAIIVWKGVAFIKRFLRERAENAADSDNEEAP